MIDDSVRKFLQNELNLANGDKTIRGGGSFPNAKPLPILSAQEPASLATTTTTEQMKGGKLKVNMKTVNAIKNMGHAMGKPLSKVTAPLDVNFNPFDAGYALGHDVISPYVVDPMLGKGINIGRAKRAKNILAVLSNSLKKQQEQVLKDHVEDLRNVVTWKEVKLM